MTLIHFDKVTKVFSGNSKKALTLLNRGATSREIQKQTGTIVALANASIDIFAGEVFVVMGLSGSGKSTFLRLINSLLRPSSGDVFIDSINIAGLSVKGLRDLRRNRISMIFQSFALFPHRTVYENICFGLDIQGYGCEESHSIVTKWIKRVGLESFSSALPNQLSGGMQQRVGVARALATGADILLMDEPFSALDPITRLEMQRLLVELQEELNKTIVFVTHDLSEAVFLADRIAILRDGRVVQVDTSEKLINNPADDYVKVFTENLRSPKTV